MATIPQPTAQGVFNTANNVFGQLSQANPTIAVGEISGQVTGAVITTLATISDGQQKQQFQDEFNSLSSQDQEEIGKKLLQASDQVQRLQILINAMVAAKINNDNTSSTYRKNAVILANIAIFVLILTVGIKSKTMIA